MKATLMLGILGVSFTFLTSAQADSDAEQAGYDAGQDAAQSFCKTLRPPNQKFGGGFGGSFTGDFKDGCRQGFDDHIDGDQNCQERINDQGKYSEMRESRSNQCD